MLGAGESNDRPAEIDPSTWERLLAVYGNSDDIDAFTGGLAERSQDGGMVGPLFAEIIRQQFQLLRDGDRFFFTHKEDASTKARGLGPVAKSAILKRTLGAVLCNVIPTDIITSKSLGKSVFKTVSDENPDLDCSSVEEMDFGSIFEESMGMKRRAGRYGSDCFIPPSQFGQKKFMFGSRRHGACSSFPDIPSCRSRQSIIWLEYILHPELFSFP